ncbi:MAG: isochorismatase family protein [Burkholderiaceae bacterium]|nr:isochorismatase family protein [Burkholderiaceae bacterium]
MRPALLPVRTVALGCILVIAATFAFLTSSGNQAAAQEAKAGDGPRPVGKTWAPGGKRPHFTAENCVFAFVDHQTGLMNLVDNVEAVVFKNYVLGLAETAKLHNVPVVLTTSAEDGPNGPLLPDLKAMFPDAPYIARPGQINAWDNADFVAAIEKTGRKKIVMSGITTDVCVAFAALSALDAGYEVYVVVDASGAMNEAVQNAAITRMADAGATIGTWFAITCELLSDWRNPTGQETAELLKRRFPAYAEVFASYAGTSKPAAKE